MKWGGSKFTPEERIVIYQKIFEVWMKNINDPKIVSKIAKQFNVSNSTVYTILTKKLAEKP